ncbi:MAG: extracellular solute-binding protein [Verrucomicrobiota bacterium]
MTKDIILKGMTWGHSRGFTSAVATAQRFNELHPNVDVRWSKRSLQEFADQSLSDLSAQFDLLIIDHPWAGYAATTGILLPLNQYLSNAYLADQAANSVGHSHESYHFNGNQWALAIDAAAPVSAYRPDLLRNADTGIPRTFDELIALGKKGLVCCPSIPLDVYGNFLNLCVAADAKIFPNEVEVVDSEAGIVALERLKQLADVVPPQFFELNPIQTMEVMSKTDEFAYAPYTYGYTNYSRRGYAANLIKFGDVIGFEWDKPGATMLGGTGLAISAKCEHRREAVQYAEYMASPETQCGLFFESGGQPGHRSAWLDEELNRATSDFFTNTLPTLDRAFVRPRYPGYLDFQDRAGDPIHEFLREGGKAVDVLETVNTLYRETRK